jgi:rod shape-determining protein MreD
MGLVFLVAWVVLAQALPDLLPGTMGLGRHGPDLFLALAVYLPLRGQGYGCVGWAVVLGATKDALSLDPLGTHAFVLGTVAWFVARARHGARGAEGLARLGRVALASVLATWLLALRLLPVTEVRIPFAELTAGALATAVWTALAAGPLFSLLDRLHAFDDLAGRPRGLPA